MKLRCSVFLLVLLLFGCAQLPRLQAPADRTATPPCEGLFPQGCWELVHTIQAAPPGGRIQTMIGVSRICSAQRTIHCVLMSLEGLVLFEADYDGAISVRRAVGPFSRNGFAEGLIQDLLLIFFAPEQGMQRTGRLADGSGVCRYATAGNQVRDIIALPQGGWQIRAYNARKRLTRTVTYAASEPDSPEGCVSRIELQAHGLAGYRLEMTLVEAHKLIGFSLNTYPTSRQIGVGVALGSVSKRAGAEEQAGCVSRTILPDLKGAWNAPYLLHCNRNRYRYRDRIVHHSVSIPIAIPISISKTSSEFLIKTAA